MAKMHEFWLLPRGLCDGAEASIEERIAHWGQLSFGAQALGDISELKFFLWGYCEDKAYLAVRINQRMMLDCFQCFLQVKTLREGYLPHWGLPLTSFGVIPSGELHKMEDIILTLPPYAAWKRLRELCIHARSAGCNLLYRGKVAK